MEVIRLAMDGRDGAIQKTLTTPFVFDLRLKPFKTEDGQEVMRWMRRARLVAREYAFAEGKRVTFLVLLPQAICYVFCLSSIRTSFLNTFLLTSRA